MQHYVITLQRASAMTLAEAEAWASELVHDAREHVLDGELVELASVQQRA
jgi:hypothetical protein